MENTLDLLIAEYLSDLRRAKGWSLYDLAAELAVSRATLSRIEKSDLGPTATLSIDYVHHIK